MLRRIINISKEKCNGCGICASACHEGAIEIIDGKATLTREDYCDGLGDCLPSCPQGAITFIEKDTLEYNEQAVLEAKSKKECHNSCPGVAPKKLKINPSNIKDIRPGSSLEQWPCQIKLSPLNASYFNNAKLLIAADCTAYAYSNIHEDFMKDKITLIGCPKLDNTDYSDKLAEIIKLNNIKNITVLKMEVPCCCGLENAVKNALIKSGKLIPWQVITISIDGKIID